MNYGLVIISHATDKTFTDESGIEFNQIVPTLPNKAKLVCQRMCDIIGYSRSVQNVDGSLQTKFYLRGTPRFIAGSRFKYTPNSIDFSYANLVAAIGDAIDKQLEEDGNPDLYTDTRVNITNKSEILNFDDLYSQFQIVVGELMETDKVKYSPVVKEIVAKYAGKGVKVSEMRREQADQLSLIVEDLKEVQDANSK